MRKTIIIFVLICISLLFFNTSECLTTSINKQIHSVNLHQSSFEQVMPWADLIEVEETNYCNDTDANIEWEVLISKYPDDLQIHALHALRIGLCFKVGRGDINLDQATEIFENMRMALIKTKERKMEEQLEDNYGNEEREL